MRFRTLFLAAALSAGFAPTKGAEPPTVTSGRAPRLHRDVTWTAHAGGPAGWRAIVDHDTGVPVRMWGPSIPAPGTLKDPSAAETAARSYLAAHLATLAPGALLSDFTLLANTLDGSGNVRVVSFAQHAQGFAVVGGAVSFTFERDHLVMIGSTSLPDVHVTMPRGSLPAVTLDDAAKRWLGQPVTVLGHGDRVVLPIVHSRGNASAPDIEYRVVDTVSVEAERGAGRWDVWLDANSAEPVARHSTLMFASGKVLFDVPDRYPGGTRSPQPAPFATHTVNGAPVTSLEDGTVTWASGPATVQPGLTGTLVAITNKAGSLVADSLSLADGGSVTWSQASNATNDAQLDSYVFANQAKAFVKAKVNPNLAWLNQQLSVNVNENQTCNAYSTGDDIHFFKADTMCENTGRIADVVYHEFGHSVHANSIIPGQGAFDGSLSEGMADTLAVSITGDHGMGRGFFYNDTALRDVGTGGKKWPDNADGEPHDEGEIIGEALWDTRVALQTKLGTQAGYDQFLKVYYAVVQNAPDIPDSYPAALLGDDDNGNLADGTPNQCEVMTAFAAHGLVDPASSIGLAPPTRDGYTVSISATPPQASACPPPSISSAVLTWARKDGQGGTVNLTANGNTWSGAIPTQPDGTLVLYSVAVTLSDGTMVAYPQNKADTQYQMWVGPVTNIWCADFENGAADWTHAGTPSSSDQWEAGAPMGIGGDPKTAHGGTNVFGIDLGSDDGLYQGRGDTYAESPEIDLAGNTSVHLQYYRWLNVEDGVYDQATIFANGAPVWTNYASQGMPTSDEINHTDKEWRFHDVDLSAQATTGKMKLKFELKSDGGLELGGWTIDDVCIVATTAKTGGTCGNGTVETGETCDDGNTTDGDGCSATCQDETTMTTQPGGCCSIGAGPGGPIALGLFTLGLVFRRRRRR